VYSKVAAIELIVAYADNTANPTPVLDTYITAGVSGVTSSNLEIVNAVIADVNSIDVDTVDEIQTLVSVRAAAVSLISFWASGASTVPSVQDYINANVDSVTTDNLSAVNDTIRGTSAVDANTTAEIQSSVDIASASYTRALGEISAWTGEGTPPSLTDYNSAGVINVDSTNLETVNSVIAEASEAQSDTAAKIQSLIDVEVAAISIIANYSDGDNALDLDNYTAASITGVDDTTLVIVNLTIAKTDYAESNTRVKIQDLVTIKSAAIAKIANWAGGSNIAPTVDDYADADVIGITTEDLDAMNNAVQATNSSEAADTTVEIQAIASDGIIGSNTASLAIIANWDGLNANVPTALDYLNIVVSGVDENNLDIVNLVLAEATFDESDTTAEIQILVSVNAAAISKISTWADKTSGIAPSVQHYTDAGVIGVTSDNLGLINDAVRGVEADTRAKIQTIFDEMTDASTSTLTAHVGVIDLNNVDHSSSITLQIKDDEGNNLNTGGLNVSFTTSNEQATLSSVTDKGDGTYQVTVSNFTIGTAWVYAIIEGAKTKNFASVVWVDEQPPVLTSVSDTYAVDENSTGTILVISATDYSSVQYSISGDDADRLEINASNGNVTFKTPPDYEDPSDANKDNFYYFIAHATALGGTVSQGQNFKVTNVVEDTDGQDIFISGNYFNGLLYKTVTSPYTSRVWLDRNLGATTVAKNMDDTSSFGYYYQWGRGNDGHQLAGSQTTMTAETQTHVNDTSSNFVLDDSYLRYTTISDTDWTAFLDPDGTQRHLSWADAGGNDICPKGYQVPTEAEHKAENDAYDIDDGVNDDPSEDAFKMFLHLPAAGLREADDGDLLITHDEMFYWTRTPDGDQSIAWNADYLNEEFIDVSRTSGASVRCIRAL
jgi:uncharacterized protein (TIGR02145 family)